MSTQSCLAPRVISESERHPSTRAGGGVLWGSPNSSSPALFPKLSCSHILPCKPAERLSEAHLDPETWQGGLGKPCPVTPHPGTPPHRGWASVSPLLARSHSSAVNHWPLVSLSQPAFQVLLFVYGVTLPLLGSFLLRIFLFPYLEKKKFF